MRLRHIFWGAAAAAAGALLYGALFETDKLTVERRTLKLPFWPERLDGYRIALIADPHVRDEQTMEMTHRCVSIILDEQPDMVVIAGDIVAYWKPGVQDLVKVALAELLLLQGRVLAVPGNHDYFAGDPEWLREPLAEVGVRLLRNEVAYIDDINWLGIDSALVGEAKPYETIRKADVLDPMVVIWHEPDMVDVLPRGPSLMLSGHSHGGQFSTPWGWSPMTTELGRKYVRGFYPHAPVPLYVSRGLATTGPPARLFCSPELTFLTLFS